MFTVDIMSVSSGIDRQNGTPINEKNLIIRWLHFDDIAAEKITTSTPEYLLANETP